jgi:3-methyladenine DNA glycosylase/8-oxoguanine DNA glycosylase
VIETTTSLPFDLRAAKEHLSGRDAHLAKIIEGAEEFHLRSDEGESPYEVLLSAITYQSISGKAAETIFGRIKALGSGGRVPVPHEMIRLRKSVLRKAGLSGAKVVAMKDLARKTLDGVVPSHADALKLSDEELIERLTAVRGIGAWTVEMFLIFRLGRPDILPIHDLAVKKGWSVTYGKKHMPKPKELLAFGERWRPYRTVASWYLWRAFERAGHTVTRAIRPEKARKKRAIAKSGRRSKSKRK